MDFSISFMVMGVMRVIWYKYFLLHLAEELCGVLLFLTDLFVYEIVSLFFFFYFIIKPSFVIIIIIIIIIITHHSSLSSSS